MLIRLIVFSTVTMLFVAAGDYIANQFIFSQQLRQIGDMASVALDRSEKKTQFGIHTIDTVAAGGSMECDPAALQRIRLQIYRSGSIKDVRAISTNGVVRCSAYPETLEFDRRWADPSDMLRSASGDLRFFLLEQFFGMALGVMRPDGLGGGIVGILGVDGAEMDVLPVELQASSNISLRLSDGSVLAETNPAATAGEEADTVSITRNSQMFPLVVRVEVDRGALGWWNRELYEPIVGLAAVLGIAFGALLAWRANRPLDPIAEMERAIVKREFRPYYQPLFELESGRIVGAEALVRWVKADHRVLPPARFIDAAERTGLIENITWQVMETALSELNSILLTNREFKLSFNVPPHQFLSPEFLPRLEEITAHSSALPNQIAIELTERDAFEDAEQAAEKVRGVRERGYRIFLDDVGVGHNGLSQIQLLDVDGLKIDKFFVDALANDSSASLLIEMLVRIAAARKMTVIAEGIESEKQSAELMRCGVLTGQGFVASAPVRGFAFLALYGRSDATSSMKAPQSPGDRRQETDLSRQLSA